MRKALQISSWIGGIAVIILLLAFEKISENRTMVTDIQVEIIQPENQLFINKKDVISMLQKQEDSLLLKSIGAINTALLEESLENHPFIADAEVFSTLDGLISVHVKQKLAFARILKQNEHYYLDANGHPFPCSENFSALVPVFTGNLDSTLVFDAFTLMQTIKSKSYFEHWLAEIHITSNGEFELIPVKGNHRVPFGKATNATRKLAKLEAFYKTAVTEENLNEWKSLNVAYSDLLVSKKH